MKGTRLQWILALVTLLVTVGIALLGWRTQFWKILGERESLVQWIRSLGTWGPIVIIIAEVLQVLLAPVPGQIVGLAAGYLYGVLWGTVYCSVGLALGSLLAMWLARQLGRPLVERLAGTELLKRVDGYAQRRGALAFFLIWLLPFLPDDLVCFIAGLTPLRIGELCVLALVGRLPGVVVSTLIGFQAEKLTLLQMGGIAFAGLLLALLFARYQKRLEQFMFRVLDRLATR